MKSTERTVPHVSLSPQRNNAVFRQEIYEVMAAVPKGKVTTYGAVAKLTGWPKSIGMVWYYLETAPSELHLPIYRLVTATG